MIDTLPTLLVIRHGETQWNVAGRLQGRRDTPLTANGMRQALAVAVRLSETVADLDEAAFWVSPLGRARQTASILADIWSHPFERFREEPLLAERSYGAFERSLPLPDTIDDSKVEAKFEKGVLKIKAMKRPEAVRAERKIEIKKG